MKISNNATSGELEEEKEEDPGAFLPLNNDDDNYDAANKPDREETGTVTGESDLLEITLKLEPATLGQGAVKLQATSGGTNVRVWESATKGTQVSLPKTWTLGTESWPKTLYVEGYQKGQAELKLAYTDGSGTELCHDTVKVTVFEWLGPLNVPGYSIHRYTATGALTSSKWVDPDDGTIKTGSGTSDVTILWGEGPVVGRAKYQVNADYLWGLEVNVVRVALKMDATNKITYKNPPKQTSSGSALVRSADPGPAVKAEITVDELSGPTRSGHTNCGVKRVQVGFVQNGKWPRKRGLYNDSVPKKKRYSSLESEGYHVDYVAGSTAPWYDSSTSGLFSPSTDGRYTNHSLSITDTPTQLATDQFTLAGDQVDQLRILHTFKLYLAVRTKDTANSADSVYTQRAQTTWSFDGDGDISAAGVYSPTGAGNTGDASSTEVTSGAVVPVTTGTACNDMYASQTWTTANQ